MPDDQSTSAYRQLLHVVRVFVLLAVIVQLIASIYPGRFVWGAFHSSVIGTTLSIVAAVIVLALSAPGVGSASSKFVHRIAGGIGSAIRRSRATYGVVVPSLVFIVGAILLRTRNHVLGDGYTNLSSIVQGEAVSTTAPVTRGIHTIVQDIIKADNIDQAQIVFLVVSIMAGLLFMYSVYGFLRLVFKDRTRSVAGTGIALLSPIVLMFLGYVENYSLLHAWIVFFIYVCALHTRERTSIWVCTLVFIAGVGLHLSFAVFLPALLWLILFRNAPKKRKLFNWAIVAYVIVIYIVGVVFTRGGYAMFLKLWPTGESSYFLFSLEHIVDLLNEAYLLLPVIIGVLILQILRRVRGSDSWDNLQKFMMYMIVPSVAFTFFVDPTIGAIRDWDLLALPSTPILIFCIYYILKTSGKGSTYAAIVAPILLFSLWHTGTWVYSNMDLKRSVELMIDPLLADTHHSAKYHNGNRLVPLAVVMASGVGDSELAEEIALRRLGIDSTDVVAMDQLQIIYRSEGRFAEAAMWLSKMVEQMPADEGYRMLYATTLSEIGQADSALAQLKQIKGQQYLLDRDFYTANCFLTLRQYDSAITYYDKVYGSAKMSDQLNYMIGLAYAGKEEFDTAVTYFKRGLRAAPRNVDLLIKTAHSYQSMMMVDSAKAYYLKALDLDGTRLEAMSSLAVLEQTHNNLEKAFRWWERCVTSDPTYHHGYFAMGKIRHDQGNNKDALEYWQRALEIDSTFTPALFQTALVYEELGYEDSVRLYLRRIVDRSPSTTTDSTILKKLTEYGIPVS
jgi:tetratricopeptide (TPR) repeat protein